MSPVPDSSVDSTRPLGSSLGAGPRSWAFLVLLASIVTWVIAVESSPMGAFLGGILAPSVATARLPSSVGGLAAVVGPLGITFPCWAARHHPTPVAPAALSGGVGSPPRA